MTLPGPTEGLRLLVDEPRAEAAEWRRFQVSRSPDLRGVLFARFQNFAQKIAREEHRRIRDMGLEYSDCEQIAYETLLHAIERFDPELASSFPSFSRPRIRGAIRNALAKANEARASYSARKRAARDRLASLKRHSRADQTDDPMEALRELVVGMALGFMIEESAQSEAEQVPSDSPSAYDSAVWNQAINAMETRLAGLPEQQRKVLDYHYKQGLQFSEIATLLGLSKGRISQIHHAGLTQLRSALAKFR